MQQQELGLALTKKLEEFNRNIHALNVKKAEIGRQIELYQRNLAQINSQLHEQELMRSPLLELYGGLNKNNSAVHSMNITPPQSLSDKILDYIKKKGRIRKSEIADKFGNGDRKIEMQTYRIVDRLEWDGKIKSIPELLNNGQPRARDFLYEFIS